MVIHSSPPYSSSSNWIGIPSRRRISEPKDLAVITYSWSGNSMNLKSSTTSTRIIIHYNWCRLTNNWKLVISYRHILSCCCYVAVRSEEHTSELQSQSNLVCRLLLEKKKK